MQCLHTLLGQLPKSIFRVKAIVNLVEKPEHPCVLQSTGKRATLTVGQPWGERKPKTQIVFIGTQGDVDGHWLENTVGRVIRQSEKDPYSVDPKKLKDSEMRGTALWGKLYTSDR